MVVKKDRLILELPVKDVTSQLLGSVINVYNAPTMIYVNVVRQKGSTQDIT